MSSHGAILVTGKFGGLTSWLETSQNIGSHASWHTSVFAPGERSVQLSLPVNAASWRDSDDRTHLLPKLTRYCRSIQIYNGETVLEEPEMENPHARVGKWPVLEDLGVRAIPGELGNEQHHHESKVLVPRVGSCGRVFHKR